ncbi:cobalamin (vitamin B12) biosynthesis CbiX protein [[Leptolyngbya] sp. PCC 7376]|uniref:sirohydrochlorin chelatase n=1 Tax=[Leptolyngbya] sp. PCC 7376 TaxID=111781 RepID=UPI00029F3B9B|nr:sirohydrochlorin chelatase [[Leptolyngbya] sp. PCC 7376]AFY39260.1 cobalamin (vitamin B12) biosynthesis CbiX protein [[Leptolyngbya] sp. PCC 7376]
MQRLSVVVVHGSYSDIYRQEFNLLLERVRARVENPVCGVYLECTDKSMAAAIAEFLQSYLEQPDLQLQILPLFLSPGVHVREDIPEAIAQLREQFPNITVQTLPYLGQDGLLAPFLERQFEKRPEAKRILLAHGSSRSGANPQIETLAASLNANTAYWSTEPALQETVALLTKEPLNTIFVVPYFLFSGRIPAAIAEQLKELQQAYSRLQFYLGKPFGTQSDCAVAIAELLNS